MPAELFKKKPGAGQLFGAAEALREATGARIWPTNAADVARSIANVRDQLDEGAFAIAWAAGRALPFEQALSEALAAERLDEAVGAPYADELARREREVAILVTQGLTNRQIGSTLVITEGTARVHVTATDVSPAMVAFAEAKAKREGLLTSSFRAADAADLPFADGQFDAHHLPYGSDVLSAGHRAGRATPRAEARRAHRVHRVGAFENNPWLTSIRLPVQRRLSQVPQATGGPDPLRYATPGTLAADLRSAGFQEVDEQVLHLTWSFRGTPEQFWIFQSDLGGEWSRPGWSALPADEQAAVETEVFSLLEPYRVGQ